MSNAFFLSNNIMTLKPSFHSQSFYNKNRVAIEFDLDFWDTEFLSRTLCRHEVLADPNVCCDWPCIHFRSLLFPDTGIGLQESPYSKQEYVKAEYVKPEYCPPVEHHIPQHLHPDMTSMAYPPVGSKPGGPYSVNGISLSAPNVDMMHPGMSYQSEYQTCYVDTFLCYNCHENHHHRYYHQQQLHHHHCAFKTALKDHTFRTRPMTCRHWFQFEIPAIISISEPVY